MKIILLILYLILLLKCGGYEDPCYCLDPVYVKGTKAIESITLKQSVPGSGSAFANISRIDSNVIRLICPDISGYGRTKFVYKDIMGSIDSLYIDSIVYSVGEKCRNYRYFYYTLAKNQQTYENDTIVLF
jgi:hypothetical protein